MSELVCGFSAYCPGFFRRAHVLRRMASGMDGVVRKNGGARVCAKIFVSEIAWNRTYVYSLRVRLCVCVCVLCVGVKDACVQSVTPG